MQHWKKEAHPTSPLGISSLISQDGTLVAQLSQNHPSYSPCGQVSQSLHGGRVGASSLRVELGLCSKGSEKILHWLVFQKKDCNVRKQSVCLWNKFSCFTPKILNSIFRMTSH